MKQVHPDAVFPLESKVPARGDLVKWALGKRGKRVGLSGARRFPPSHADYTSPGISSRYIIVILIYRKDWIG